MDSELFALEDLHAWTTNNLKEELQELPYYYGKGEVWGRIIAKINMNYETLDYVKRRKMLLLIRQE